MRIHKHHLTAILLMGMTISPIQSAAGTSYNDAPKLEPFALTQEIVTELTQIDPNVTKDASFRLKGMTITAENQEKWGRIELSVDVDPRLNLWRGRPNDLASSHLGSLNLIITSITDDKGKNIYDASRDKPWDKIITIYNRGKGVFSGSRIAYLKPSKNVTVKQISGKVQLSLPVNLKKYIVKANSPESIKPLLRRNDISSVRLKNGIYIQHPKPAPDFDVTIMGFNGEGKRISIVSRGSAGSEQDNHWYYFSNDATFDKMLIFIPEKFINLEIPFSINVQN